MSVSSLQNRSRGQPRLTDHLDHKFRTSPTTGQHKSHDAVNRRSAPIAVDPGKRMTCSTMAPGRSARKSLNGLAFVCFHTPTWDSAQDKEVQRPQQRSPSILWFAEDSPTENSCLNRNGLAGTISGYTANALRPMRRATNVGCPPLKFVSSTIRCAQPIQEAKASIQDGLVQCV